MTIAKYNIPNLVPSLLAFVGWYIVSPYLTVTQAQRTIGKTQLLGSERKGEHFWVVN